MAGLPSLSIAGSIWKLATIGAGFLGLVAAFFLVRATWENHSLSKQNAALAISINDPQTGYIVRLSQARANVIILQDAITKQNSEYQRQSDAAAKEMARLKTELGRAQNESRLAKIEVAKFLATKPQGNTLEKRVNDVDSRVLKVLKNGS